MEKIKHFFKSLGKRGKKIPVRRIWPRSQRDWELLLAFFFLLLILAGIGGVFLFQDISRGEIFQVEQSAQNNTFAVDRDLLTKTIDFYQNKARNLEEITAHPKVLVDPSL